ncbi:unnamed protein product [Adineta steineri]|uniref:CWH43-like N-terminal domain-containing protein n=3 Tax=Adineta steineri TaxID=433720 RepID=A0A818RQD9_9BILA|nr:unnamed protein product [Adineta steineri]CAF3657523.1 unnamed protein product [Adineta steineri]
MARTAALIWYWSLVILPFTAIITFILTLVVCNQILQNNLPEKNLPQISQLGIGPAYPYFVFGFVVLSLQMLLILIGRLQYLFQSQSVIHRTILYVIHALALISAILLLIMAIVSLDHNPYLHVIAAMGMFTFISFYCLLHTVVIFYLYARRSIALEHSNIILPIWFLICAVLLTIFASIWISRGSTIPQYIAAAMPFLYILGFIPQFWIQANMKPKGDVSFTQVRFLNEID